MERIEYAIWLARQAMDGLFYFWPITLTLVVGIVVTFAMKPPFVGSDIKFRSRHLFVLLPLATTSLILVLGTVMEHSSTSQNPASRWPSYAVLALFGVQLLISIWIVWLMKGYRWFSAFAVALQQWFALWCVFVAGISIAGDWL